MDSVILLNLFTLTNVLMKYFMVELCYDGIKLSITFSGALEPRADLHYSLWGPVFPIWPKTSEASVQRWLHKYVLFMYIVPEYIFGDDTEVQLIDHLLSNCLVTLQPYHDPNY
ncbi:unnamed protein product [Coffea canephora]|uniref:Uncharacterized protein n=1 Tax=Coffea canephora TaxID=49390 RepID=A0A068UA32_COFCA|nr:unnamed protein product [Coffea canephora]